MVSRIFLLVTLLSPDLNFITIFDSIYILIEISF